MIEIDNLVTGLKNRLVLAVQRVVRTQNRTSIRDMKPMIAAVGAELQIVEEQWGVHFHEIGFSTFSPTPETLEITQLRNLAEEKLQLYQRFRAESGLSEEAAVALISGAVIAMRGNAAPYGARLATAPAAEAPAPTAQADGGEMFPSGPEPDAQETDP
jgi:hypothetical protein